MLCPCPGLRKTRLMVRIGCCFVLTTCAVKLPPEQGQTLRDHYDGIRPAYHLNKVHWNDVFLDEIDGDMVKDLVRQSYLLVLSKLPKRLREKYIFEK